MTELLELRGVVEAGPDAVASVLLDDGPGGAVHGHRDPAALDRQHELVPVLLHQPARPRQR